MTATILGASSQSTPALFQFLDGRPLAYEIHFRLVARTTARLQAIVRAINHAGSRRFSIQCHDFSQSSLECAVKGAEVVLIQVRYGGLAGREFDENFPLMFGVCGDEGLGPG